MRNLGFLAGIAVGYMLFTEDGKEISKKFLGSIDKATDEIMSASKSIIKETMPETSKALSKEE